MVIVEEAPTTKYRQLTDSGKYLTKETSNDIVYSYRKAIRVITKQFIVEIL